MRSSNNKFNSPEFAVSFIVPLGVGTEVPAVSLSAGSRIGEFQVVEVLGCGRESVVYRARDRARNCDVALKEYLPAAIALRNRRGLMVTAAADAATFDAGRRAFLREAMELCRIRHACLIRVHRAWHHAGTAYVAMPLVQGMTLEQACAIGQTWTQQGIHALLRPLLDLLTVMHRRHCTGLDLRARQILIQPDGRPMLMGLGLRAVVGPGGAAQARQADPAWRDLQALARTLLVAMQPGCQAGLYAADFLQALHAAADDDTAPQHIDTRSWMNALALPERRARVRLNREFEQSHLVAEASRLRAPANTALDG